MRQRCSEEKRLAIQESMRRTKEKRSFQECHVYQLKINLSKLNKKQKEELKMMFVEGKRLKNHILNECETNNISVFDYQVPHAHEKIRYKNKDGEFVDYELSYIGSQMAQDVLKDIRANQKTIIKLTKNKLQKGGKLKYCSEMKVLNLRQYGTTYKFKGQHKLRIQGISGFVYVRGGNQFWKIHGIELANAKLLNTPSGYYISITTYQPKQQKTFNGKTIAFDFGCQTSVTDNYGNKTTVSVEESEHMKTLQRKLQRQTKGSNNRFRTICQIRKCYQQMMNRKKDIVNKFVHNIKDYSHIIIQDEQLKKWHKDKRLSKTIQHSCLGLLKSKLKQLENCVVLDKDIPTTKVCMNCGKIHEMDLSDRTFICDCGIRMDRDVHAANNMIDIVETLNKANLVPMGRREIKRVEFLKAYEKKFDVVYGTMKHEAHDISCRG